MSKFYLVEHLACPSCKNRSFTIKVMTPYRGALPIQGEEIRDSNHVEVTCNICRETFCFSKLIVIGKYDPAAIMEKALNEPT